MLKIEFISEVSSRIDDTFLLTLPQELVQGLKVEVDGTIDTKSLLGILLILEQETRLKKNVVNVSGQINLMLNIYDSSRAWDFKRKAV
ncbi:MAG: hypothetical protein Q7V63_07090 [Gammaproteobacteria bacterium]|nr:hypothetical protein [Gammaproteobacteria bacterium]